MMFSDIQKRYKWYVVLRIVIVSSILVPGILTLIRGTEFNLLPLILILSMTIIMSVLFMVILKTNRQSALHYYIQLIFDNLLIFSIIYYTGGNDSIFSILYYLNITTASFFLLVRGGFIISILSTAGYAFLMLGEYFGIFVSPYEISYIMELPLDSVIMRVYINALSFFLISALSGFLSERLQTGRDEAALYRLKLKDIINNLQSAIIVINKNKRITDFSKKCKEIFPEISNGNHIESLDDSLFSEIKANLYSQFSLHQNHYDMRIENVKYKDIYDNYIITINDITSLKRIEQKLIEKERLSAIGELAASIAHEIRNPLSNIKGSVKIIQDESGDDVNEHPMFKIVLEEIERLNKLIVGFLDYSRATKADIQKISLSKCIDSILRLFNQGDRIGTENIYEGIFVYADEDKLKQVMINLLNNSLNAIADADEPKVVIAYRQENQHDHITVSDNGKGIAKESMDRLFIPFNTTQSKGTGLGLAIVYKIIVEEHGGDIKVSSKPGNTCIDIILRREL